MDLGFEPVEEFPSPLPVSYQTASRDGDASARASGSIAFDEMALKASTLGANGAGLSHSLLCVVSILRGRAPTKKLREPEQQGASTRVAAWIASIHEPRWRQLRRPQILRYFAEGVQLPFAVGQEEERPNSGDWASGACAGVRRALASIRLA